MDTIEFLNERIRVTSIERDNLFAQLIEGMGRNDKRTQDEIEKRYYKACGYISCLFDTLVAIERSNRL